MGGFTVRRWLLAILAAACFATVSSGEARANVVEFRPELSILSLHWGSIPGFGPPAELGSTTYPYLPPLAPPWPVWAGNQIVLDASLWQTTSLGPGTAMFTGMPLMNDMRMTVTNLAATLGYDFGFGIENPIGPGGICSPDDLVSSCFGGYDPLSGQAVIEMFGGEFGVGATIPLTPVGGVAGGTARAVVLNNQITLVAMPFVTATVRITGVTTNLVSVPARGGAQGAVFTLDLTPGENAGALPVTVNGVVQELHTVTINGTNNLASNNGTQFISLISPMRINTGGISGHIPAMVRKRVVWAAPEPGATLILLTGVLLLVTLGRRRL